MTLRYLETYSVKLNKCQWQKTNLWLSIFFKWYIWGMSLKLLDHNPENIGAETRANEKLQQGFIIVGMRSYLLKVQPQM